MSGRMSELQGGPAVTTHDPLCPGVNLGPQFFNCQCTLITRIRADEREQIKWEDDNSLRMVMGSHDALLAHAEAVTARLVEVICEQEWQVQELAERWAQTSRDGVDALTTMRVERDAARAEVAALREQIASDIEALDTESHPRSVTQDEWILDRDEVLAIIRGEAQP